MQPREAAGRGRDSDLDDRLERESTDSTAVCRVVASEFCYRTASLVYVLVQRNNIRLVRRLYTQYGTLGMIHEHMYYFVLVITSYIYTELRMSPRSDP
jgi:hypothetical protein